MEENTTKSECSDMIGQLGKSTKVCQDKLNIKRLGFLKSEQLESLRTENNQSKHFINKKRIFK